MNKRLTKSRKNRMVAGVAAGIAEYTGIDPVLIRLAFVLGAMAGFTGVVIYIVLAIVMPAQDASPEPAQSGDAMDGSVSPPASHTARSRQGRLTGTQVTGLVVIVFGVMFLMLNLGIFSWLDWGVIWPVGLIVVGLTLMAGRLRRA